MDNNYSLSDIKSALGDCNEFGGSGGFLILIVLFLLLGGNFNGFNRDNYGQFATSATQQEILFGQQFQSLDSKIDRIANGICDSTFALNNSIKDGNYAVSSVVTNEGRALQSQLAQCCCDNREATAQVRYDMANFAASINSNIDNKFAALEKSQLEQRLEAQAQQISQLQIQQAVCGIPRVSNAAWGVYPYPAMNNCCGNI